MDTGTKLLKWYRKNQRQLPMRETKNPYLTWISEVIFQQTRIEQGLPYYYHFIDLFPDIKSLAFAKEDVVLKTWQGLGYYSRAHNLMFTAKFIYDQLNSKFPTNYNDIIRLKGIGPYTAAAIASWCFGEKITAVDGNVYRVLSRIFDSEVSLKTTTGKKFYNQLGLELMRNFDAGEINQALIDLGATVCKPQNPKCSQCPVLDNCLSFKNGNIANRPVKELKTKVTARYFNYLVLVFNNQTLLKKRIEKDIWQGLYEFPLIETKKAVLPEFILNHEQTISLISDADVATIELITFPKHQLSHQVIHCTFYVIKANIPEIPGGYEGIDLRKGIEIPLPIVLQRFINQTLIQTRD
jgi:A/G-specific adenine glycosylase